MQKLLRTLLSAAYTGVFVFAVGASHSASAADAASNKQVLAEKLVQLQIELVNLSATTDQVVQSAANQMDQEFRAQVPGKSDSYYQKVNAIVVRELSASIKDTLAKALPQLSRNVEEVLVTRFSEEELRQMWDYQSSPTGRKSVQVMNQEMSRLMESVQKAFEASAPELARRVDAALRREGISAQ